MKVSAIFSLNNTNNIVFINIEDLKGQKELMTNLYHSRKHDTWECAAGENFAIDAFLVYNKTDKLC